MSKGEEEAGMRKGSAPVGEAWLLDGTVTKSMHINLRYALRISTMLERPDMAIFLPAISNSSD